jgi:transcriptional regulator with XRE-family HTH domain
MAGARRFACVIGVEVVDEQGEAGPEPVDIAVGHRIKLRRNELGMSQERLGEALGITFQQVQKYERGTNRVSASRLSQVARELRVPVGYFFGEQGGRPADPGMAQDQAEWEHQFDNVLQRRETLDLVRAYWRIPTKAARKSVYDLVRSLGAPDPSKPEIE